MLLAVGVCSTDRGMIVSILWLDLFEANLTQPRFIEVPVQNMESERSCICVLGMSTADLN